MFTIQDIRGALTFGGARPNYFQVQITSPAGVANAAADTKLMFTARASVVPGEEVGVIPIHYFGRIHKVPGDRTIPEWTITVINDEDHLVRDSISRWMQNINGYATNTRTPVFAGLGYESQAIVRQFGKIAGVPMKEYVIRNIWPSAISQMDVDWNAENTIQEFSVTFQCSDISVAGVTL